MTHTEPYGIGYGESQDMKACAADSNWGSIGGVALSDPAKELVDLVVTILRVR